MRTRLRLGSRIILSGFAQSSSPADSSFSVVVSVTVAALFEAEVTVSAPLPLARLCDSAAFPVCAWVVFSRRSSRASALDLDPTSSPRPVYLPSTLFWLRSCVVRRRRRCRSYRQVLTRFAGRTGEWPSQTRPRCRGRSGDTRECVSRWRSSSRCG